MEIGSLMRAAIENLWSGEIKTAKSTGLSLVVAAFAAATLLAVPLAARADESHIPCGDDEQKAANEALSSAGAMIDGAISGIESEDSDSVARLTTWFGIRSSSEAQAVKDVYVREKAFLNGVTFFCNNSTQIKDIYAEVLPNQSFAVHLSLWFFQAPDDGGFSSKSGTLVHEMSHFLLVGASTDPTDYGDDYGPGPAAQRAANDPDKAQHDAENFEYFAEATAYGLNPP